MLDEAFRKEVSMTDPLVNEPVYEPAKERWRIRYKDATGRDRSAYAKKQSKAQARYEEIRRELEAGTLLTKRIGFNAAADEALEERAKLVGKKNGIRSQVYDNDERHLRLHLRAYFGDTPMKQITTGAINRYIQHLVVQEMAPKTQRHVIGTLNMVCKHAVDRGYLLTNPCAKEDRTEIRGSQGQRGAYHADDLQMLLAQTMTTQVRALIMTSAWCGIAGNELQGLQWRDVDLYAGSLTIDRTGYRYMVQDETKTEHRRRTVPIPSATIKVLREWQLQCPSSVWVFPAASGRMGEQNAWRKLVATVCRHAGVDDKGLGGFRKFYHTQMEMAGVPESIRKYRMGHSKKSNTAKIHYTDADIKAAQNVADIETIAAKFSA